MWLTKYTNRRTANHFIDINVDGLPKEMADYIWRVIDVANDNDFRVELHNTRSVPMHELGGGECNGWVDDDPRVLSVACGQPVGQWFPTLVHESCHMDQVIEHDPLWYDCDWVGGVKAGDLFDLWMDRKIELVGEQKWDVIAPVRTLELDCERRSLRKIVKFCLPLDERMYAKAANAYIYYYNIIAITRKWYGIGNEPYNNPHILDYMPTDMDGDYERTPPEILAAFVRYLPHTFEDFNIKVR